MAYSDRPFPDALVRDVGPAVVVSAYQHGADVENAWDVLMTVMGGSEGERLVREVAAERGVDPELVLEAAYRKRLNDLRLLRGEKGAS